MQITVERDVPCTMRDGCVLRANVVRPADDARHPVLLLRTPYDKNVAQITFMTLDAFRAAEAGYAVVHQDTRGRFASDGTHRPFITEPPDGYDTVEWAASQPWSNGGVGVFGTSYQGFTAWAAGTAAPPHLRAIAPSQSPNSHHRVFWRRGAFQLGMHAHWSVRVIGPNELQKALAEAAPSERLAASERLVDAIDDFSSVIDRLPLAHHAEASRGGWFPAYFAEQFAHRRPDDPFHHERSIEPHHSLVRVPALITAGWHDPFLASDLAHYVGMRANAATAEARDNTTLLIGPWTHGAGMHSTAATEVDFGVRASGLAMDLREDLTAYHLRWFDRWLGGAPESDRPEANVRFFVMGANRWRDADEWPPPNTRPVPWYLHGDTALSPRPPAAGAAPLTYRHDPASPVPTVGGSTLLPAEYRRGSVSQAELVGRPDVLSFTSDVLGQSVEVIGHVQAVLWAATSGADADWIVKLCDVTPDGRTFNVCDGIVRASRRDEKSAVPEPVEPGVPVRYDIDLLATAMVFHAGHRMRVLVMSSDFPRYDRNPGTGEWSFDATRLMPTVQHVFCDAGRQSMVVLPAA